MNNKGRGLVTVVIILAVICIVFLVAGFSLLAAWGGARFWEEIPDRVKSVEEFTINQTQEHEIEGIDKFELSSISADMNVVYADTDTVKVELIGSYRSSRGSVKLEMEKVGDTVRIYVDYPKISGLFNWNNTDLTITLPMEMGERDLEFSTVSGDIDIPSGLQVGRIKTNSTSGDVKISDIYCESVNSGNVSGRFDLTGSVTEEIRVDSVSGDTDISIATELELIYVNTVSGDVDIYLDDGMDFKFESDTVSGSFDCDFPVYQSGGKNDRKGYTSENAEMELDINTVSGDLRIRN